MTRLRIATFDLGHDDPEPRFGRERLAQLAAAIVAEGVDVVFLQELTVSRQLGHQAHALATELRRTGESYAFFHAPANGSFEENGELGAPPIRGRL